MALPFQVNHTRNTATAFFSLSLPPSFSLSPSQLSCPLSAENRNGKCKSESDKLKAPTTKEFIFFLSSFCRSSWVCLHISFSFFLFRSLFLYLSVHAPCKMLQLCCHFVSAGSEFKVDNELYKRNMPFWRCNFDISGLNSPSLAYNRHWIPTKTQSYNKVRDREKNRKVWLYVKALFDVIKFTSLINKTKTNQQNRGKKCSERQKKDGKKIAIFLFGMVNMKWLYKMPYLNKQNV